jgi:hypothetical protein
VDNQAAIQSTERPAGQSGQYILRRIVNAINLLHKRGVYIELRWIPAHTGVPGNEAVDVLAKKATGWRERGGAGAGAPGSFTVFNFILQSSCKQILKARTRTTWESSWPRSDTGVGYRKVFGPGLNKKINLPYSALPKALSSVLIQMRTGFIGLNSYLHKIKRAETPYCDCESGYQTVPHILGDCYLPTAATQAFRGSYYTGCSPYTCQE